ncbi:MAG: DUF229 domain-containing protein [Spirochaetaceae bacterium]|nr:MAG: DUF229 domain-containing protein [Spirochaetaceae bacterium]
MLRNSTQPMNVVVIKTDQQRSDTIAALGNSHMITPHLDRLVHDGVAFTNAFCCGATCVASRAAFYTGQFAHNTGCYSFEPWAHNRTWLHEIRDAGYRTAAVGKVHHSPGEAPMAFDERLYVENFPEMDGFHDDYATYLKAEGQESGCRLITMDGNWMQKCASDVFPLDEKYHVDQYVGRMAVRWIRDYDASEPFYLHVGFQGPHDPFDPPQRFLEMYDGRDVPLPHRDTRGLADRPPQYARHMEATRESLRFDKGPNHATWGVDLRDKDDEQLRRMRRHYYALVTQIDEMVGTIVAALESRGMLENTLLVFTSDHGENLGDHDLMYKWLMTDQTVRVPMVVRFPDAMSRGAAAGRAGSLDQALFTQIDFGPTILDALGIERPQRLDGRSAWARWVSGDLTGAPDRVYCEDTYLTMVRTADRKLIMYAGQEYEEYFDISTDEWEENNLAANPEYRAEISDFKVETLEWLQVSRYLGSLPQIGRPNGRRAIWPENHPHDPFVLHPGCIRPVS